VIEDGEHFQNVVLRAIAPPFVLFEGIHDSLNAELVLRPRVALDCGGSGLRRRSHASRAIVVWHGAPVGDTAMTSNERRRRMEPRAGGLGPRRRCTSRKPGTRR
jgi:hypothetical protein